ncbi:MAG TPA: PAS domain-containing sensor histidine kinase, partial [Erythrobacter sp.]|nr:PAS domain-containing sensor histidine kinase [Erythrobacter sp.]
LPKPHFRNEDALDLVRQALFLQEVAHPQVNFRLDVDPSQDFSIACDRHQLGQAMTNVLKNAVEAVETRAKDEEPDYRGKVQVAMALSDEMLTIEVEDNGVGLPQDRERIVEPYVTTREKGTGLGLAIVNKIVDEHGGEMSFSIGGEGGTRVTLKFSRDPIGAGKEAED